MKKYGLPMSIYVDRHTTYKSSKKLTEWDEVEGIETLSQFERALKELGVEVIHALSPQAKGRVERLFGVFQDRLVKEMRLRGITTKDEANAFLEEYLPRYNERFGVCPANEADVHVPLPRHIDLDRYLCIKRERTIRKDNTIALDGRLYQLEERGGKKVVVEERLDGSLHMISNGVALKYKEITERPKKEVVPKTDLRVYNRPPETFERSSVETGDGKSRTQLPNKGHLHINQIGHFYFGRNRTFLLWLDSRDKTSLTCGRASLILVSQKGRNTPPLCFLPAANHG